jgi:hypothetical protein
MTKLTIDEYSKLKGISKQAVYKKLDKLNTKKEKRNGKTITIIFVDDEELQKIKEDDFQPNSTATDSTVENVENVDSKPTDSDSSPTNQNEVEQPNSTVEFNRYLIEVLENQLKEKDKQIEQLIKANTEQAARFSELLYRSQQLEAQIHLLLPIEAKDKESAVEHNDIIEADKQEQEKKKGFFKRIFGKKD